MKILVDLSTDKAQGYNMTTKNSPLLQIPYSTYIKGYFPDKTIRKKYDKTWIVCAKVKPEIDLLQYIEKVKERDENPTPGKECRYAYRKQMVSYFPKLQERVLVNEALNLLGEDVDGAWSTLDDYGIKCDVEELVELSKLKEAAHEEYKNELKSKEW